MSNITLSAYLFYFKTIDLIQSAFNNLWFSKYQYTFACFLSVFNVYLILNSLNTFFVPLLHFITVWITGLLVQTITVVTLSYLKEKHTHREKEEEGIDTVDE